MKIEGFNGINNRQPIDRLKPDEAGRMPVRDAVNVDLSSVGTFQRRAGSEKVVPLTSGRSFFGAGQTGYCADGSQLKSFDGTATAVISTVASDYADVAYTKSPRGLIWSDGFTNNLIAGGVSRRLATQAPNPEPVVGASGAGSLRAGSYGVSFASVGTDGQQSAMTYPVYVAVPENGAIQITCPAYASRVAVFVTAQNGEIFYRETYIEQGQTSAALPFVASAGQPVKYEVTAELPPGGILALHNGRLIVGDGAFVYYSQPYNYGIHRPAFDYIPMGDEVTLIAPVEGGVFIATTKETRFFAGGDIASAEPTTVLPYGASKGTLTEVPDSTDLMWFSARGPVRGRADGSVTALQDKQIAFEPMAEGAGMYREQQGMRQYIAALTGKTGASGAVFGSYMDAEVIKGN